MIISKNLFGPEGLGTIFDVIRTKNWSLSILDVAENTIKISLLHSLRQMIEVNPKLKVLSITGLYHFNNDALESIADSLEKSKWLKVLNLHKTSKECLCILKWCNMNRVKEIKF